MDDSNQIEVPPSFTALFTSPAGRLTEPMSQVRTRYELCEDLAQLLIEQASGALFKTGKPESELLRDILRALSADDVHVQAHEAVWVVRRLAELLDWNVPDDIGADG